MSRRNRAPLLTFFWVALVLAGCPAREATTVLDLAADLPFAEVWWDTDRIDFGTPAARRHLGEGWSWDAESAGTTFAWGVGDRSELGFFLSRPRDLGIELRGRPFEVPGGQPQRIAVSVNGSALEALTLERGMRSYGLRIPASLLRAGENRLVLQYAYSRSPAEISDSADTRPLAVAWDFLGLDLTPAPGVPRAEAGADRLVLPPGTQADFFFAARPGDRLVVAGLHAPGETAGSLEVWLGLDGAEERRLATLEPGAGAGTVELPLVEPAPARLRLRSVAGGEGGRPTADLLLSGARIERPGLRSAIAAADRPREPVAPPAHRPNLVIYLVDTLRADHLGAYGYRLPVSPALDAFAAEAILFERAVAQSSWTKPAMASLFTGLLPTTHGVHGREHALPDALATLAESLRSAGYRTGAVAANAYFTADSGLRQGFESFTLLDEPADRVHEEAVAWLDRLDGPAPFFLYLHTIDPHAPFTPPEPFRARFAPGVDDPSIGSFDHIRAIGNHAAPRTPEIAAALTALYDAEVAFNDFQFGRLLDELRARGLDERTVVVFLSDHGEELFDHGALGHGWALFQESLAVPLVVRLPGGRGGGRRIAEPVQQADLLPTLLEILGIEAPAAATGGLSLAPLLLGEGEREAAERPLLSHLDYDGRRGSSLVHGDWKLIEPLSSGFLPGRALYDLAADPGERANLARHHPVRAGYLAFLARRLATPPEGAPAPEEVELDEVTRERLRALGYLD